MAVNQKIVVAGPPRTGSTLCWQLVKAVFSDREVLKTHPAAPAAQALDDSFVIVTIRNPYDVAASRYRSRLIRDESDGQGACSGNWQGLEAELCVMKRHFDPLTEWVKDKKRLVFLRYEEFYNDYDVVFDMMEKDMGREVLPSERMKLKEEFSLQANQLRSFGQTEEQIKEHGIHKGHIGTVSPGMWRATIPEWGFGLMDKWCGPIAKEWGYE